MDFKSTWNKYVFVCSKLLGLSSPGQSSDPNSYYLKQINKKKMTKITSWWFQPSWKLLVKLEIFPKYIVVKIENIWNHHLDKVTFFLGGGKLYCCRTSKVSYPLFGLPSRRFGKSLVKEEFNTMSSNRNCFINWTLHIQTPLEKHPWHVQRPSNWLNKIYPPKQTWQWKNQPWMKTCMFNWNMVTIPFSDKFLFNLWGIEIWGATSDENIKA